MREGWLVLFELIEHIGQRIIHLIISLARPSEIPQQLIIPGIWIVFRGRGVSGLGLGIEEIKKLLVVRVGRVLEMRGNGLLCRP